MRKHELVEVISSKSGYEKSVIQNIINYFMETVSKTVIDGEEVYLRGFGTFKTKHKAKKKGRSFKDNTEIVIPAHDIPSFKPSKKFLDSIKEKTINKY